MLVTGLGKLSSITYKWRFLCYVMLHPLISAVPSKRAVSANKNIVDTSLRHLISGQYTTVVKGCMYIWLIW